MGIVLQLVAGALAADVQWVHETTDPVRPMPRGSVVQAVARMVDDVRSEVGDAELHVYDVRHDPELIGEVYPRVDAAPTYAVRAVHAVSADALDLRDDMADQAFGVERDLWLDGDLVVARRYPDGHFEVWRGPMGTYSLPVAPRDISERTGSELMGPFTERERAVVWAAMRTLDPLERTLFEGTRIQRRARRASWSGAVARYTADPGWWPLAAPAPATLVLYGGLYDESIVLGGSHDPVPSGVFAASRKLGLALASAGTHLASQSTHPDAAGCAERFDAAQPVVSDFLAVAEGARFTDVGVRADDPAQIFADAWALHALHPEFLALASPPTWQWFEAGGHTNWLFDAEWQACLPDGLTIRSVAQDGSAR
jgi:hypothetical protein